MEVKTATVCELTVRCRAESSCSHHVKDCEHKAGWEAERVEMAKGLADIRAEIAVMERIRDELLALSWEGRRRALEWMWGRFVEHPSCSDDPKDGA